MYASLMSVGQWLEQTALSAAMENWPYVFTAASVTHYFSFFIVVGLSSVIDLRLLGVASRRHSVGVMARHLFPWMWTALAVATVSGFLMFAPEASTFFQVQFFTLKLFALLLAVIVVGIIQWKVSQWEQLPALPPAAKLAGLLSLALWIGTLISALEIAQYADI